MADNPVCVSLQEKKPIKIVKWKVREGNTVPVGRIILLYEYLGADKPEKRKLKAGRAGTIHKIIAQEGGIAKPGDPLYESKVCLHPTIMNDMCAECGTDLRKDDTPKITASVPMVHTIPDLKVSQEQAEELGRADSKRLLKDRKLVLLVDLDQTLIHTTNDNIPPNIKDVYHFQLYGPNSPWYHTRLRPGTHEFLNNVFDLFELHICTFGARNYAHTIAMFLDPDQKFFSNRILSRDECFDPTSKKANLRALFPCGDNMVCIIDDREDVWSHASNLIHVKPYHFFQHTGDINAPPGLDKHEDDDKAGIDLNKIIEIENEKELADTKQAKESTNNKSKVKNNSEQTNKNNNQEADVGNKQLSSHKEKSDTEALDEETVNNEKNHPEVQNELENSIKNSSSPEARKNGVIEKDKTELKNGNSDISNDVTNNLEEGADSNIKTQENNKDTSVTDKSVIEEDCNEDKEEKGEEQTDEEPKIKFHKEDNLIEIEDPDDYLIYLEGILKRIHDAFYEEYDKMECGKIPDLKHVIPTVKSGVLKGLKLVFSGLVPTHVKLEQSKAYLVARSLGAVVTQDLDDDTTHLVAVRPGTAKVNTGRRRKNLKIVTPDWLWCCAERWEHVDERIFPLNSKGSKNRHPPPHCSSPEHVATYPEHGAPELRKRTPSGRFMDTINPLMSFSSDDIANMDKEVEDILDDDESEDDDVVLLPDQPNEDDGNESDVSDVSIKSLIDQELLRDYEKNLSGNNSSEDSCDERPSRKRSRGDDDDDDDDLPSVKFRRGESIDEELDVENDDMQESDDGSIDAPDSEDDGEWNMMGAALEREFLSD